MALPAINFPLSQIIEGFRKYDGSTCAETWLRKFNLDLAAHNFDEMWAISNLDRVLLKSVKSWWISNESVLTDGLTNANKAIYWDNIQDEIRIHFGGESLKQQAKLENSALRFALGDDPQNYVLKKTEIFASIDPRMSNARKIDYLVDGLPEDLAIQMLCSMDRDNITPMQFMDRLRACINYLQKKGKIPEQSQSSRPRSHRALHNAPDREAYLFRQQVVSNVNQGYANHNASPPIQNIADRRQRACYYCGSMGHMQNECYQKARDEGRPLPPPKERRHNPRERNWQRENPNYFNRRPIQQFQPRISENSGHFSGNGPAR